MTDTITINVDGREVRGKPGQTILQAAEDAGIYIPRLCWMKELTPAGSCRVCLVRANGRAQSACTQPIVEGLFVENDSEELRELRRSVIDMLFVEGNHFCMSCEKSGACELQALAYRFGITAPRYPFRFPRREIDATHPDVLIDRDRCIVCGRCVRASRELDGKSAFGFVGRGHDKRIAVNAAAGLVGTDTTADDAAVASCPTGSLLVKRVGYVIPVGERRFDRQPIGADIEAVGEADASDATES